MGYISENYEAYLATVAELLLAEGMIEAADALREAEPKVEETGYDNWNGGTTIWTIYLRMAPANYAQLGANREALEEQINKRLKQVLEQHTEDWFGVKIVPEVKPRPEWRQARGSRILGAPLRSPSPPFSRQPIHRRGRRYLAAPCEQSAGLG